MISATLKRSPAQTNGGFDPAPTEVIAGAFRRAWSRLFELGHRERRVLENVLKYEGDLDSLLARHDVRHARHLNGAQRVFRAPDLVVVPAFELQTVRWGRPSVALRPGPFNPKDFAG